MNIEIMRNTLYKAYLEDFYGFCQVKSNCIFAGKIYYDFPWNASNCYLKSNMYVPCSVQKLGGATAEIMSDLLAFEADRRAVNITINR